jgi:hypothetical protein
MNRAAFTVGFAISIPALAAGPRPRVHPCVAHRPLVHTSCSFPDAKKGELDYVVVACGHQFFGESRRGSVRLERWPVKKVGARQYTSPYWALEVDRAAPAEGALHPAKCSGCFRTDEDKKARRHSPSLLCTTPAHPYPEPAQRSRQGK